jgi:hypothetical protein
MAVGALWQIGCGFFFACKGKFKSVWGWQLVYAPIKAGTCGIRYVGEGADPTPPWMRVQVRRGDVLGTADRYIICDPALKFSPRPIGSHAGGGVTKGNSVRTLPTRSCRCNQLTSEELSAVTQ